MHAGGKGRKEKRQDLPGTPGGAERFILDPQSPRVDRLRVPQSLPTRHGQCSSILTVPTVRNNCSGHYPLPSGATSTSFFRSQVCVEINKNGTGWEEWLFLAQNRLADGLEPVYSYKWCPGDTASANASYYTFVAWAYSPNGTCHHRILHDVSTYEEHVYRGFACLVADNYLT
jgi:hypothetical protein